MNTRVRILTGPTEGTVCQHRGGYAAVELTGDCHLSDPADRPVIRVVDITTNAEVVFEQLACSGNRWQHRLKLPPGCYRVETGALLAAAGHNPAYLAKGDLIRHLFVGEVFVIAGQSNAAGYGREPVRDLPHYGVQMYNGSWQLASHPIGQMEETAPNRDFLNCGHSPWLNLGKLILNNCAMPVGLVPTALNGSGIEAWAPGQPLYQHMIAKARATGARHLIWHQGCSDVNDGKYQFYEERLDQLLSSIKKELGDIYLYLVQISGTTSGLTPARGWRMVREMQRRAAVKHQTFLIPTYDLTGYSDDIHLSSGDNIQLSYRIYDRYISKFPAQPIGLKTCANKLELTFHELTAIAEAKVECQNAAREPLGVELTVEGNRLLIGGPLLKQIRYITLPFTRVYQGQTITSPQGACLSYFMLDLLAMENS